MSNTINSANALSTFNFKSHNLHVSTDEQGNPWFQMNEVCRILKYKNPRDAVRVHCRARGVAKRDTLTAGGKQQAVFIDEGNLYRLIIKSNMPEAEPFESWVCDEVLPAIRKTGSYTLTISAEQQERIKEAVLSHAERHKCHYGSAYRRFYRAFKTPRYQDLPASRFEEAIQWLEGEYIPRETVTFTDPALTHFDPLVSHQWLVVANHKIPPRACPLYSDVHVGGAASLPAFIRGNETMFPLHSLANIAAACIDRLALTHA